MTDFNTALGQSESGGNYGSVNTLGYFGKYQWGNALLQDFNRSTGQNITRDQFIASPDIQEAAQNWSNSRTDAALAPYVGATINGVAMTPDSLRAIAHLGGIGGATKYVTSGGKYNPSDAYGTSLSDYAGKFSGGYGSGQNALAGPPPAQTNALAPERPQLVLNNLTLTPYRMT